jgi:hypothetical protein
VPQPISPERVLLKPGFDDRAGPVRSDLGGWEGRLRPRGLGHQRDSLVIGPGLHASGNTPLMHPLIDASRHAAADLATTRAGSLTLSQTGTDSGVSALYVDDVNPVAILIRMRVDTSRWHIVDSERELTWCGLFLSQGSDTRLLSETPSDRRCGTCVDRFEVDVLRRPDVASASCPRESSRSGGRGLERTRHQFIQSSQA